MAKKEKSDEVKDIINSEVSIQRIAMVDVDRVVAKSGIVKKLRGEHEKKVKELERWLKNVKKQLEKPDSSVVQSKLIKRYDEEFAQKKAEMAKDFQEKLQIVNAKVSAQITEIAKEHNYDIVLAKSVVVCGCIDITELIEENIK